MKIFLVRHGEIRSNLLRVYSGRSNESLTIRGMEQAHEAGRFFAEREIEIIYASPLRRALMTAEIIAQHTHVRIEPDPGLTEFGMGVWEGKSEDQIAAEYPNEWKIWLTRPAELRFLGRESLQDVLDRVLHTLSRIKANNHHGSVVIVTHYALVSVALLHAKGQDLNLYRSVAVPNCIPFELEA